MNSQNLLLSIITTVFILVAGAALASKLKGEEHAQTAVNGSPNNSKPSGSMNHLSIALSGSRSSQGKVLVMVFDNSDAFARYDHTKAVGYQETDASDELMNFDFPLLVDGPYAVFIMHDENSDYRLNQSEGYPIEGFVVSGAKNKYDEPSFKQASVARGQHNLKLTYF